MGYKETLEYIHSVQWRGSRLGLERTRELMEKLGNPEKKLKFVHIAGTNGKGSTSACIESILRAAGYKTGLYTSPYINRFNERIRFCGVDIEDDELVEVTDIVRPIADSMEDKPTEFELITAVAMVYFVKKCCDIVVLEVGLGGEMDSTNVIETPEIAVITAMGLDHTRELGSTLGEIAKAKAGIIKSGGDVVIYGGDSEADEVFEKVCAEKKANLIKTDFSRLNVKKSDISGSVFSFCGIEDVKLPLAGLYQPKNAAVAITAVNTLRQKGYKISDDDIKRGLSSVYWPGRFEILRKSPVFVLDGAHNPHGIRAAVDSIVEFFGEKNAVIVTGVMADKDVGEMVRLTKKAAKMYFAVRPDNPRAMAAAELSLLICENGGKAQPAGSVFEGVKLAVESAGKDGVVCALGSLYFSAEVRNAVKALGE